MSKNIFILIIVNLRQPVLQGLYHINLNQVKIEDKGLSAYSTSRNYLHINQIKNTNAWSAKMRASLQS